MKHKFINVAVTKSDDDEDRTITAIGSTSDVDRDRDVIDIKGMDLKNYKNNPVILWSHDANLPPIAKATSISKTKDGLKFKLEFAGPDVNAQADTIFKLYKGGFLSAFSVGFMADWEAASYDEKRGGFDFPKTELLELSAVNVPANQNALIQRSIDEGCIDDFEAKDIQMYMAEAKSVKRDTYTKDEINCMFKRFDVPPVVEVDETPPIEDLPKEVHIVDQALEEIFAASDDKSTDATEEDEVDDLNSIFDELE